MFSFPKSNRFTRNKQSTVTEFVYNVYSTRDTRTTTFGHGKRMDFTKSFNSGTDKFYEIPSSFRKPTTPNSRNTFGYSKRMDFTKESHSGTDRFYDVPSSFRKSTPNNKSSSFGIGKRMDFTKSFNCGTDIFYDIPSSFRKSACRSRSDLHETPSKKLQKPPKESIPGPGTYNVVKPINNDSQKYSMYGRFKKGLQFKDTSDIPGPGYYTQKTIEMKSSGVYPLSTQRNTLSPAFGMYSARSEVKVDESIPGPGKYSYFDSFTGNGVSSVSKFKSSLTPSMHAKTYVRKKIDDTPGPGDYKIPSDFGIYISKHATIDTERKKNNNGGATGPSTNRIRSNRSSYK